MTSNAGEDFKLAMTRLLRVWLVKHTFKMKEGERKALVIQEAKVIRKQKSYMAIKEAFLC